MLPKEIEFEFLKLVVQLKIYKKVKPKIKMQ
jgi:hypothetical protein